MTKIWIAGSVAANGQSNNVRELVETFSYFDGACFTVNLNEDYDTDEFLYTVKLLEDNKKEGRVLLNSWVNLHYIPMTMAIQCGKIKESDWVLVCDAQETPKKEWLESMRDKVAEYEKEGIGAVFWGRPYFFKFNSQILYQGSTHCWPHPLTGKTISIQDESKVKYDAGGVHFGDFIYNKKNLDDTTLLHACKYTLCYNITNEIQNQWGTFGPAVMNDQENLRRAIRDYLINELGLDISNLDALIKYLQETPELPSRLIEFIEVNDMLKTVYRFYVLKQSREDILKNRYNWSLQVYLMDRIVAQKKDAGFIGLRNKYNLQLSRQIE